MLNKIKSSLVANKHTRHKWVEQKLLGLKSGTKILDAGCGTQRYRKYCKDLDYKGQDFGKYTSEGEGLQSIDWDYGELDYTGDIWNIEEVDSSFEAILCTEVIEHLPFPNETIAEFSRLLKANGQLILTAPYSCLPHMQPYFFYSGFSVDWYRYFLEKNNFEIVEITPNGNFFTYLIQENLRGINIINNNFIKFFYCLALLPKLTLDIIIANFSKNTELCFGFHVVAKLKS